MPKIVDNGVENLESGGDAILRDVQGNRVSPAYHSGQDVSQYDSGCAGALGRDSVSLRGRAVVSDAPEAGFGRIAKAQLSGARRPAGRRRRQKQMPVIHGKPGTYVNLKCRCELCRAANARYMRQSRAEKRLDSKPPIHHAALREWRKAMGIATETGRHATKDPPEIPNQPETRKPAVNHPWRSQWVA